MKMKLMACLLLSITSVLQRLLSRTGVLHIPDEPYFSLEGELQK